MLDGPLALVLPVLLAVAAGVSIVVQQGLNAELRTALDSAAWAGLVSYLGGTLCMIALVIALRHPVPAAGALARVPWWVWTGGFFGAVYIALAILLLPKLGATAFVALLIAGQMLASLTFDRLGLFGIAPRPVDASRLIGVCLLIGGVVLIRR